MKSDTGNSDLDEIARSESEPTLLGEFLCFLRNNKKWWLLPILVIMLLFGALLVLSNSAVAPFIYTLF